MGARNTRTAPGTARQERLSCKVKSNTAARVIDLANEMEVSSAKWLAMVVEAAVREQEAIGTAQWLAKYRPGREQGLASKDEPRPPRAEPVVTTRRRIVQT